MKTILHVFMIIIVGFTLSCGNDSETTNAQNKETERLLIYCGITMSQPVSEIAKIIEEQEHCKIEISVGGSGNLYKAITVNQIGDLYLPGSKSYVTKGFEDGIITDTAFVGTNRAVIMLKKGNPKNIKADLESLTNPDYRVIIGEPSSGSIGKETKKILDKKGIFEQVSNNAVYMTSDSKDLIPAIKNDEADIIINWYATSTRSKNNDIVDVIEIGEEYAKPKELYLSLLKYSKYPETAKKIMDYAKSEKGKAIFKKYGF